MSTRRTTRDAIELIDRKEDRAARRGRHNRMRGERTMIFAGREWTR